MKNSKGLEAQIHSLPELNRQELAERYQRLYAKPPSRRLSREQMEMAMALQLQKLLNANLRAKMMQVLTATEAITSILIFNSRHTELVREWRGRIYSVTLLDDGVMYDDRLYRSLSAVARVITGKRCCGSEFFGVSNEKQKKATAHAK